MEKIITVGLDLAKSIFQVHGIAENGKVLVRRTLRRSQVLPFFRSLPACLVGMEACASAHHWAREIAALGHAVRMMPPAYVKPYVKRNKTDVADAEAICEAVTRPTMRFVPVKTAEQQASQHDFANARAADEAAQPDCKCPTCSYGRIGHYRRHRHGKHRKTPGASPGRKRQ